MKPASEIVVVARRPLAGTVAQTVLEHGTGAIHIDACRVSAASAADRAAYEAKCASVVGLDSNRNGAAYGEWAGARADSASPVGRWPSNVVLSHHPECVEDGPCVDGCPVAELDAQSGDLGVSRGGYTPGSTGRKAVGTYGAMSGQVLDSVPGYGDTGGASRYFPTFRYEAKADASERPKVGGVAHCTVKPLALMRWLVRLVTPPGGTVLEPFAGSGTTIEACLREGFRCIAVEREAEYLPLIDERIRRSLRPWQPSANEVAAGDDEWTLFGGESA